MAQTWYLTRARGESCGPGTRSALAVLPGLPAQTLALDATGDTWNRTLIAVTVPGLMHEPGTWSAFLFLRKTGVTDATINVVLARYNSACVEQEQMVNASRIVSAASFTEHTFSGSAGLVAWHADDLLMCIVTLTAGGTASIEYNQPATPSRVVSPDVRTVRPWHPYANQR